MLPRQPPYVVLPPGSDLDMAVREVAHGWRVCRGFAPPQTPWDLAPVRVVAVGVVDGPATAQAALLCAVRGAGLVAVVDRDRSWAARFLADLGRLAPAATPGTSGLAPRQPTDSESSPLTAEQRDLLDLLADGRSIAQAARLRYLSLRTANRRVAEARAALGVSTTREAVLAYVRLRDS
jgi:DNA-binding NarL/FixJ family response regulator